MPVKGWIVIERHQRHLTISSDPGKSELQWSDSSTFGCTALDARALGGDVEVDVVGLERAFGDGEILWKGKVPQAQ